MPNQIYFKFLEMIYLHIAIKFNLVKNKNKNITLSFKVFSTFQNSSSQTRLL